MSGPVDYGDVQDWTAPGVYHAARDWTWAPEGWRSADGWLICRGAGVPISKTVWIAVPPPGCRKMELQADDLCTCMERAEGMW